MVQKGFLKNYQIFLFRKNLILRFVLNHTGFDLDLLLFEPYVELNRQKISSWFELDCVPTEFKVGKCELNIYTELIGSRADMGFGCSEYSQGTRLEVRLSI